MTRVIWPKFAYSKNSEVTPRGISMDKAARPDIRVSGQTMIAFVECSNQSDIRDILERHGLGEIDPNRWYSQQKWLNVLLALNDYYHSRQVQPRRVD